VQFHLTKPAEALRRTRGDSGYDEVNRPFAALPDGEAVESKIQPPPLLFHLWTAARREKVREMRTSKSFLQSLTLLCALGLPMLGLTACGREDETEVKTPEGEVEVETERDASGQTEEVEVDDDRDRDGANLGDDLEDSGITAKVATQLASDDRVKAFDVDVETQKGVVTLKGNVDDDAAKAAAEEIVRSIDGVQDVQNLITVGGGDGSAT
jgi:hypothetical protein